MGFHFRGPESAAFPTLGVLNLLAWWMTLPRPIEPVAFLLGGAAGLLLVAVGLAAAAPFGKGAPWLGGRIRPALTARTARVLALALLGGALLGGALLALMIFVLIPLEPGLAGRLAARIHNPAWWPLAAAFEASVLEETVFRLFLLSGTVWLLGRGWRKPPTEPSRTVVATAVIVSALGFALVHLPAWIGRGGATPLLVAFVLGLNGIAGVAFSRVYWRFGIETAIVCHFAADMAVQGLGPRLVS